MADISHAGRGKEHAGKRSPHRFLMPPADSLQCHPSITGGSYISASTGDSIALSGGERLDGTYFIQT